MGALLRGTKREQVTRGQVIAAPGSIKSAKKFKAQVYVSNPSSTALNRSPPDTAPFTVPGFDQGRRYVYKIRLIEV